MTDNTVNKTHNPEIQGDQPNFENSISETRNEENDTILVHNRQYPRQVRETTPDDADEEHVVDAPSTATELIPKWFKMPEVPTYDGTSDPQEHITSYTTAVIGNDLAPHEIESVLLTRFGETLTRGALTWYSLLPEHSIDSFEMLANSFIKAHAGARKADVHNRYESKIRIENDQVGFSSSPKGREKDIEKSEDDYVRRTSRGRFLPYEQTEGRSRNLRIADKFTVDRRTDRGQNNRLLQDKEVLGSRDSTYPRLSEYNFNVIIVEFMSAMRNIKEARFPRPMRSDPGQRDPNVWCEYHGTNGHRTGDCRHLRKEVATLLMNGHLREFLSDRAKNNYGRNRDNAEPLKA
ncbi:PREDICTED: uncharacterized protein LOC109243704 [Nicotiana attenuata]|uniref:uncharacterized protein LOC109243704 n=1 Tax=Nicotiana attenuata TaxID=49451 RepID=UPI000905C1B3|nr:PREDICTED: uncharacterized protein LOC109243704 [Nicotiana attenuata]